MVPPLDSAYDLDRIKLIPVRREPILGSEQSVETSGRSNQTPADDSPELDSRPEEEQGIDISDSVTYEEPTKVEMPSTTPAESGDENATDRPATTTPDEPGDAGPAIPTADDENDE